MRPDFIFDSSRLLDILSMRCLSQKRPRGLFSFPILSLTHGTVSTYRRLGHARYPFHPSDMMHAGTLQDISSLWSAPLMDDKDFAYFLHHHRQISPITKNYQGSYLCRFLPEQYLFTSYLKRHSLMDDDQFRDMFDAPSKNFALSRSLIDESFVFAGFSQIGLYWHKQGNPFIYSVPFTKYKTVFIGSLRHHFSKYFPNVYRCSFKNSIINAFLALRYCLDVFLVIVSYITLFPLRILMTRLKKRLYRK